MARRQEEPENHWPGFVDALSTIVMVVTFLLIILGISIFILSQKVSENLQNAEDAGQITGQQASASTVSGVEGIEGQFKQDLGKSLKTDTPIESSTKLAIRSQRVKESKEIEVASDETEVKNAKADTIKVTTAQDLLTLLFDAKTMKLDAGSNQQIKDFLTENPEIPDGAKLEIWSFARSGVGSISEARRIAYYRAMDTRNSLLQAGVEAPNISVRVRETDSDDLNHRVKVFLKPTQ